VRWHNLSKVRAEWAKITSDLTQLRGLVFPVECYDRLPEDYIHPFALWEHHLTDTEKESIATVGLTCAGH
jgi:hypothetical protein